MSMLRCEALLANLPHGVLIELTAQAMREIPALRRRCDAAFAEHAPVAEWAVASIFTSPDLLPSLIAPLGLKDSRLARVCTAWKAAWLLKLQDPKGKPQHCYTVGSFSYARHVTALPHDGVIVPNYGGNSLHEFSPDGDVTRVYVDEAENVDDDVLSVSDLHTPSAVALDTAPFRIPLRTV